MPSIKNQQLRLRVFAGPNGSGKSTVIQFVRNYKVKSRFIDFGFYINADDIATALSIRPFKRNPKGKHGLTLKLSYNSYTSS